MNCNSQNFVQGTDLNNSNFYKDCKGKIDNDLARLKKYLTLVTDMRMMLAEVKVDTAILYHADLWYDIKDLKMKAEENIQTDNEQQKTNN